MYFFFEYLMAASGQSSRVAMPRSRGVWAAAAAASERWYKSSRYADEATTARSSSFCGGTGLLMG